MTSIKRRETCNAQTRPLPNAIEALASPQFLNSMNLPVGGRSSRNEGIRFSPRPVDTDTAAEIFADEAASSLRQLDFVYPRVSGKDPVVIVGAGPAGLFAALRAIELGIKPIVIERGKDVRSRRRDLAAINKDHVVNPESNYCFGEGCAVTYSDGKLYTRSKKR